LIIAGGEGERRVLMGAEQYTERTMRWSSGGITVDAVHLHTATLLKDGRILLAGGLNEDGPVAGSELGQP
jgi:hypothetical protein